MQINSYQKLDCIIKYYQNNTIFSEKEIFKILTNLYDINLNDYILNKSKYFYFDKKIFDKISKKYINGYPLEYCTNTCYFLNQKLYIKKPVLIPRPETEELVLNAVSKIKQLNLNPKEILDIGTGSGAISCYLAWKFTNANIVAIEKYKKIINSAKKNFSNFQNIQNYHLSFKKFLKINKNKKYDVIISNPPYISIKDIFKTDIKTICNESKMTLFAKHNGLYFYQDFIKYLPNILNKNFLVAFEIGYNQKSSLEKIINSSKFFQSKNHLFIKDINGKDRIILIWK